eukprot:CAMPEP_0196764076 /NCGR_PEP_ID=MMETSP1095-20130614/5325_1 /TAXON_ID=96789 ORGANISM="Chromulina nebulosa, Strain UTEXLB2642" /NCGR_SAMPLE_ID=MMETSP1095 /ASSEMBLY_ACC=CAM_ASM_000446 /LENGTH=939 /DNA_ID=CAMNT_0042118683 /DNA_START=185 /DNA_END=3004 /DNA_ORIENTATION=-
MTWSHRFSSTLRGNLVRTYNAPIETDFYINLDQELGKGGCGVVVVGERKDNHELYAIKFVNKATAELPRLDRELKLLKDVDHTNIVRLFSVYDQPERMYFVMELCTGGHLGALLARQPKKNLDEEWAKVLCKQLISAVAHIHSRGIAHRDIKLQNVLMDQPVDATAQVKLIDFGYGSRYIGNLPMKTKCGTPYTTAPEVLRENYDERCDVWSVGVVLYIMLSGRRPFESLDIAGPLAEAGKVTMITNILAGRYHFNHSTFNNVSEEAKEFVKLLLNKDYTKRITSKEALEHSWLQSNQANQSSNLVKMSTTYSSTRAISNMKIIAWNSARNIGMIPLVFGLQPQAANSMRELFQTFDTDSSGSLSRAEYVKAMAVLAPELTAEDINKLFDIIDIDGDGGISYTEFLAATLDPRGIDMVELTEAFNLMDADGNGFISIDEIRQMINVDNKRKRKKEKQIKAGEIKPVSKPANAPPGKIVPPSYYDDIDSDSSDDEETKRLMEQRVKEMIEFYDVNHDGMISYDEFLWAMTGAGKLFGELPPALAQVPAQQARQASSKSLNDSVKQKSINSGSVIANDMFSNSQVSREQTSRSVSSLLISSFVNYKLSNSNMVGKKRRNSLDDDFDSQIDNESPRNVETAVSTARIVDNNESSNIALPSSTPRSNISSTVTSSRLDIHIDHINDAHYKKPTSSINSARSTTSSKSTKSLLSKIGSALDSQLHKKTGSSFDVLSDNLLPLTAITKKTSKIFPVQDDSSMSLSISERKLNANDSYISSHSEESSLANISIPTRVPFDLTNYEPQKTNSTTNSTINSTVYNNNDSIDELDNLITQSSKLTSPSFNRINTGSSSRHINEPASSKSLISRAGQTALQGYSQPSYLSEKLTASDTATNNSLSTLQSRKKSQSFTSTDQPFNSNNSDLTTQPRMNSLSNSASDLGVNL